jgi:hypothetical protein
MKGAIKADHMPTNKFDFKVVGLLKLTAVTISGIEEEILSVDLPDHTTASSGEKGAIEFELELPVHHTAEFAAMELWYKEAQDPISPTYKKPATLTFLSISGRAKRSFTIVNCWVGGRDLPDLNMEDEGDIALVKYKMKADELQPI